MGNVPGPQCSVVADTPTRLGMARYLPLFLAAANCQELQGVKHVLAGDEYIRGATIREDKSLELGNVIPEEKFTSCKSSDSDIRSFHDFTTEDIEKVNNVSFSDPQYTNKVLLVVNLASF